MQEYQPMFVNDSTSKFNLQYALKMYFIIPRVLHLDVFYSTHLAFLSLANKGRQKKDVSLHILGIKKAGSSKYPYISIQIHMYALDICCLLTFKNSCSCWNLWNSDTQPHKCWDFPFSHRDSIVIWMAMWNISGPHTGGWTRGFGSSMRWNGESVQLSRSPTAHPFITVKIPCILRTRAPRSCLANCNGKKWASALWELLCMNAQMNWHAEHESYRGAPLETRANRRPCSLPHNDDSANGTLWRGTGPGERGGEGGVSLS